MAVYNPPIPYIGPIPGGLSPGKTLNLSGSTNPSSVRFAINLQVGPNVSPRDDVALHIAPDFNQNCILRNSIANFSWGLEERHGGFPLIRGQPWNIIILCEASAYKIAINGHHFTEFPHRIPFQRITHLAVDGDTMISTILYPSGGDGIGFVPPPSSSPYPMNPSMPTPMPGFAGAPSGPYPGAPGAAYPGAPTSGYPGAYPGAYPGGPPRSPQPSHYSNPAYPHQSGPYPQQPGSYVHPDPNLQKHHKKGFLANAGAGLAGAGLGAGLLNSVVGHKHGGKLAALGGLGAVGAGLGGAALTKKALKKQKKHAKKALKFGLPVAGLGVGAYALSKGFHGSSSSSSSSYSWSSGSSEEE